MSIITVTTDHVLVQF